MIQGTVGFQKKVAQAVSNYCKAQGISHRAIAEHMGLSKSQIDGWFSHGNFSAR